jgi:hypothetical protein
LTLMYPKSAERTMTIEQISKTWRFMASKIFG